MYCKIFFLSLLLLSLTACASKTEPFTDQRAGHEVQWKLSPQALVIYHYLEALDHLARKDSDNAVLALENALSIAPNYGLFMELARVYRDQGKKSQALSALHRGIELFPQNPDLHFLLAEFYLEDNKQEEAVQSLMRYKDLVSGDLRAYENLAAFYLELNEHARVVDLLEEIPADQRSPEINYYLGRASSELGDYRKASAYLQQAVRQRSGFLQAWAEKAFIYEQKRNYLQAEKTYQQLLRLGEFNPDLILRIVELNLLLNNPDNALKMARTGPEMDYFQLRVVQLFVHNGFFEHARSFLQDMMLNQDYSASIYFYLAVVAYEGFDDAGGALEHLQQVPVDSPKHLQALTLKLQIFFSMGEYEHALELARDGQQIHPSARSLYLYEAVILEITDEYAQAMTVLDQALEMWPKDTDFLFRKGVVWDKKGEKDKSMQVLEEVIAIDQEHHQALNYVGYTLADQDQDLERSLILIQRALELDPGNGYYIDSLAWVYYRQGKFALAWEEILRAVKAVNDDPVIWEHYGDIARALSRIDDALFGYKQALVHGSENGKHIRELIDKIKSMPDKNTRAAIP